MAFATEDFSGFSDGQALTTSGNWSGSGSPTPTVTTANGGKTCYVTGTSGWNVNYWNAAQATSADYTVQADFFVASSGNIGPGVAGRIPSGSTDGYLVYWQGGQWSLWRRLSGSVSGPLAFYAGDAPTGAGKTALLRMVGSTISVEVGAIGGGLTQRISYSDATPISAKGYAGIGAYYPDGSTSRYIDNWSASDISGTTTYHRLTLLGVG